MYTALEKNNGNTGGTYIEKGPTVLYISSEGLAGSISDIENIVVKQLSDGAPLLIRDVADVHIGHATRYGAMCYNDEGEVAGAVVMMLKGGNSGKVIKQIKERIEEIKKSLPEGVDIEPFLDRTKMVNNAIGTVEKNLVEGSLIVVFILVLFLGNIRAGFIVASIIPLSMLFAVIMMNLFGVSGNLMSLGALDFGLIVDGAVIIVEAVMHRLSHSHQFRNITRLKQPQMDAEVKSAASRMMNSAVFGQIIILIVYLPIFSLQGIEGKMFRPMAETVAFALLGAFILSLTYIPMMSALFISKKIKHAPGFSDRAMAKLENGFSYALKKILNYPKMLAGGALLLFAAAIWVLTLLGGEFIPQLEEGDFAIDTRVLTGSNLHTTINAAQKAAGILKQRFPEVEKVVIKIGSGEIPTDPMPMEAADMMVILKDKKTWTSAKSFPELAEKMSTAVSEVPGITTGFQFPVQMRFNELMTGARQDVVCKIFGDNLDTLARYASELGKLSSTVPGARDIYVESVTGLPQIIIMHNREAIAKYGLNIETVNNIINAAFGGQTTGQVFEGEKRFDMVVRLSGDDRKRLEDVQNLLVPTPQGTQVPLYQLADVSIKEGPAQIQREDTRRRIIVGFNVRGRDVQSIVNELQQKATAIQLPAGYYITYGGAFENLVAAKKRLSIVVPLALGLIFLMLYFAFGSIKQSLIIYSAIPLSAIGGAFALALRGMPFSISAGVGFIALFGVAVLNGIVLIAEFRRLHADGIEDLQQVVLQGTKLRLRPVLMTASVASLGFLPMALSNGAGAEVQRPLATVVIGGLLTATFLTLFLLPVLYILFEKINFKVKHKNVALLLLLVLPVGAQAQQPITLNAAIDSALHNNLELKSQRTGTEAYRKMRAAGWNLGKTNVTAEWGNINSAYTDTRYGISQTIAFPLVYVKQRALLHDEWKAMQYKTSLKEKEMEKEISLLYNEINCLYQKRALLQRADSLYAAFEEKAALRYKLGASDVLEKTTAESQRGQAALQLQQLEAGLQALQAHFVYLLHTTEPYIPAPNLYKAEAPILPQDGTAAHPLLAYLDRQQKKATTEWQLEKAKLLPELSAGYFNQSFSGWQLVNDTEHLYSKSDRFGSVQFGIGLPVFFFGQSAKVKALELNRRQAALQLQDGKEMLSAQYAAARLAYNQQLKAVEYYEQTALRNAAVMTETATRRFEAGEIDYLEYTLLLNQSFTISSNYYDALKKFNESVFEINYLTKN